MKLLLALAVLFGIEAYADTFVPVKILTSCAMATSCTSNGMDINQLKYYAIQAVFTGTPAGVLKLQISTDDVAVVPGKNPAANVVNWSDYTGSPHTVAAAGNFTWNVFPAGYRWIRMVYTDSGSADVGSLSATFNGKGN